LEFVLKTVSKKTETVSHGFPIHFSSDSWYHGLTVQFLIASPCFDENIFQAYEVEERSRLLCLKVLSREKKKKGLYLMEREKIKINFQNSIQKDR
jgi:hypothetical protein